MARLPGSPQSNVSEQPKRFRSLGREPRSEARLGYGRPMNAIEARDTQPATSGVRLAELVATLSLAADIGLGQPMEHIARSTLLACRLGEQVDLDDDQRASLYYVALFGWVGCIADSHQAAASFGDDISYRRDVYDLDMKPLPFLGYLLRRAGSGGTPLKRLEVGATLIATGASAVQQSLSSHCQVTSAIAGRLGLGPDVTEPLRQIFARWDGKGLPRGLARDEISILVRLWHVADVAEVHFRRGGLDAARSVIAERRSTQFDPDVVAAFEDCCDSLFDGLSTDSSWDDLIATEPALRPVMNDSELDNAFEVMADYADLKSPYLTGHSRGVAELAAAAAVRLGLSDREVRLVRRAALVHDLGRTGVSNVIWDKPAPLTAAEAERARLVPYFTERMLARPRSLAEIGALAAMAYERLDGSGYHRGLSGFAIPVSGRVLAAADAYHELLEPRPSRKPLSVSDAARHVTREAAAGRLDPDAVDAVLTVAGAPSARPPTGPSGLTKREVEVLVLLARGASNRQIAKRLGITTKTAGNHIERIYAKAGISTRAAATLFAMQHGLLRTLEPIE